MPSTYSNLKIQLMATGENNTSWGDVTNVNLGTALEEAVVGSADVAFSNASVTLTLTNTNATQSARNVRLNLTGNATTGYNLVVPAIEKPYIINNATDGTITVKNTTGTGIAVPTGKTMWVFNNGTNVVDVATHLTSLTLGTFLPIASGGTGGNTAANARTALSAAVLGANSDITSLTGLTTPLSIAQGGTSANTAALARTALSAAVLGANSDITSLTGLTTPLSVAQGGTGSNTAALARTALSAAVSGANSDITSLTGLTTPLSIAQGGTGSNTAALARTALGVAASGANTDITALDQDVAITATGTIAADTLGFRGLPQNSQTGAYTLALSDAGKHISITTGGVVVPSNSSIAFPTGTAVVIFNNSGTSQNVSITTDTMYLAGTATTGTRALAQRGLATCVKVASTTWVISGAGLT